MARYYQDESARTLIIVPIDAAWTHSVRTFGTAEDGAFGLIASPAVGGTIAYQNWTEGSINTVQRVLFGQYVSEPFAQDRPNLNLGTVLGYIGSLESNTSMNACPYIVCKIVSGDGQTVRGEIASYRPSTTVNEFGTSANYYPRPFPPSGAASLVNVQAGDRLVVEVGVFVNNTSSTSYYARLQMGSNSTRGDCPTGATAVGTNMNPWIDFSNDPAFGRTIAAPDITVIEDEGIYRGPVSASWNEQSGVNTTTTISKDGGVPEAYTKNTPINAFGVYQLIVTALDTNSQAQAQTVIDFVIAPLVLAPTVSGVESGTYAEPVTPTWDEQPDVITTATLSKNGGVPASFIKDTTISSVGIYQLVVTAGPNIIGETQETTVNFSIYIPAEWQGSRLWAKKDYLNFQDLNRIGGNVKYVLEQLRQYGYSPRNIQPITEDYTMTDFPTVTAINRIRQNIVAFVECAFQPPQVPVVMVIPAGKQIFDNTHANALEQNLQGFHDGIILMVKGFKYSGTFAAGQDIVL